MNPLGPPPILSQMVTPSSGMPVLAPQGSVMSYNATSGQSSTAVVPAAAMIPHMAMPVGALALPTGAIQAMAVPAMPGTTQIVQASGIPTTFVPASGQQTFAASSVGFLNTVVQKPDTGTLDLQATPLSLTVTTLPQHQLAAGPTGLPGISAQGTTPMSGTVTEGSKVDNRSTVTTVGLGLVQDLTLPCGKDGQQQQQLQPGQHPGQPQQIGVPLSQAPQPGIGLPIAVPAANVSAAPPPKKKKKKSKKKSVPTSLTPSSSSIPDDVKPVPYQPRCEETDLEAFMAYQRLCNTHMDLKAKLHLLYNSRHSCQICQREFKGFCRLKRHLQTHAAFKPYKCEVCNKRFYNVSKLKRHSLVHSGLKPYKCPLCDSALSRREHLKRHMLTHSEERPYRCNQCDYSSRRLDGVHKHIRSKHMGDDAKPMYIRPQVFDLLASSIPMSGEPPKESEEEGSDSKDPLMDKNFLQLMIGNIKFSQLLTAASSAAASNAMGKNGEKKAKKKKKKKKTKGESASIAAGSGGAGPGLPGHGDLTQGNTGSPRLFDGVNASASATLVVPGAGGHPVGPGTAQLVQAPSVSNNHQGSQSMPPTTDPSTIATLESDGLAIVSRNNSPRQLNTPQMALPVSSSVKEEAEGMQAGTNPCTPDAGGNANGQQGTGTSSHSSTPMPHQHMSSPMPQQPTQQTFVNFSSAGPAVSNANLGPTTSSAQFYPQITSTANQVSGDQHSVSVQGSPLPLHNSSSAFQSVYAGGTYEPVPSQMVAGKPPYFAPVAHSNTMYEGGDPFNGVPTMPPFFRRRIGQGCRELNEIASANSFPIKQKQPNFGAP